MAHGTRRTPPTDGGPRLLEVEQDLAGLRVQVHGLEGAIQRIENAVANLADRVSNSSRTNWGWLFAAGGLCVTVLSALVVLGAKGPLETLGDLKSQALQTVQRDIESAVDRGRLDERVRVLREELEIMRNRMKEAHPGMARPGS